MAIQALKINQGPKFGTLKKPMFSLFDVIIFWFNDKKKTKYFGHDFQWVKFEIICAKKEIITPGYYLRKYVFELQDDEIIAEEIITVKYTTYEVT